MWYPVTADISNSRAVFRVRPPRTWSMREALPGQGFTQYFSTRIVEHVVKRAEEG